MDIDRPDVRQYILRMREQCVDIEFKIKVDYPTEIGIHLDLSQVDETRRLALGHTIMDTIHSGTTYREAHNMSRHYHVHSGTMSGRYEFPDSAKGGMRGLMGRIETEMGQPFVGCPYWSSWRPGDGEEREDGIDKSITSAVLHSRVDFKVYGGKMVIEVAIDLRHIPVGERRKAGDDTLRLLEGDVPGITTGRREHTFRNDDHMLIVGYAFDNTEDMSVAIGDISMQYTGKRDS